MDNRPKWLLNLLDFVFDNIIAMITIGFAMYLVIRQEVWQESFSTNQLLAAVIMVLGLLATSEILERYRKLRDIDRDNKRILELIESRYSERPSALTFFQKPINLDPYFQNGQQMDLCGVTLTTTINKQFANIRTQLKRGAYVRIIVIDPDPASFATSMAAARSVGVDDHDYYLKRLDATFNDIKYLFKSMKTEEPHYDPALLGKLEVRVLNYAPSYGIISLNAGYDNGVVIIELYDHASGFDRVPTFELSRHRDGDWYDYYCDQFEQMWSNAKLYKK